jgi:hypothetical protein
MKEIFKMFYCAWQANSYWQWYEANIRIGVPYILESNAHPNLMRTQFLATS